MGGFYDLSKTLGPKTPKILMMTDEYSLQDLLEQFKGAMEMSSKTQKYYKTKHLHRFDD
jgi:hypothetical protein